MLEVTDGAVGRVFKGFKVKKVILRGFRAKFSARTRMGLILEETGVRVRRRLGIFAAGDFGEL